MTAAAGFFSAIVDRVEYELAQFYGFHPQSRASDHLLDELELVASLGEKVRLLPEFGARAGVFLSQDHEASDLFIGIRFAEQIRRQLEAQDPRRRLDDRNLDGFCVLVEEVSHFHLILNRASSERGVSKLELEWQGEIDKLLVSALFLQMQYGESHLMPLARRLFDTASIVGEDEELYWQATRHAARFWFEALRRDVRLGPELRDVLRRNYHAPLEAKLRAS